MRTVLNWLILALVTIAATVKIALVLQPATITQAEAASLPLGAVRYLREQRPAGPMFNSYNWGGYLIWALYPDYRVFVDGRTDLYDDAFLRDYLKVALVRPGWEAVVERYDVRLIVIERESVLATVLALTPDPSAVAAGEGRGGWRLVY
ncbi:MAG TPA: hypothetical protein IGS52_11875, partial [Oscillatoriaceae cyanobacterium M33_DOE_052]|nr:hypothetical protein [Oscillatoriaceae cyanobacterium M33_DOE_052]